jgi:hypothetical protein
LSAAADTSKYLLRLSESFVRGDECEVLIDIALR